MLSVGAEFRGRWVGRTDTIVRSARPWLRWLAVGVLVAVGIPLIGSGLTRLQERRAGLAPRCAATSVSAAEDGTVWVVGQIGTIGSPVPTGTFVLGMDRTGEVTVQKHLGADTVRSARSAVVSPVGLMIAGRVSSEAGRDGWTALTSLDQPDREWMTPAVGSLVRVTTRDGGLLVAGVAEGRPFAASLSDPVWRRELPGEATTGLVSVGGDTLVAMVGRQRQGDRWVYQPMVSRLDASGEVGWTVLPWDFGTPTALAPLGAHAVVVGRTGGWPIAVTLGADGHRMRRAKFDKPGSLEAVVPVANGWLAAGAAHADGAMRGWVVKLGPRLDVVWESTLTRPRSRLADVVVVGSTVVVVGHLETDDGRRAWVAALSARDGSVLWERRVLPGDQGWVVSRL